MVNPIYSSKELGPIHPSPFSYPPTLPSPSLAKLWRYMERGPVKDKTKPTTNQRFYKPWSSSSPEHSDTRRQIIYFFTLF